MARDQRTSVWRPINNGRRQRSGRQSYYQDQRVREYSTDYVANYNSYPWEDQTPRQSQYDNRRIDYQRRQPAYAPRRPAYPQRQPYYPEPEERKPVRIVSQEEFLRAKAEGYGRFYINKQITHRTPMVLVTYGGALRGLILKNRKYNLDLLIDGEKIRINKHDLKFMYKQSHESKILPYIEYDENVKALGLGPETDVSKRYQIDDKVLIQCYREHRPIVLGLRGGEIIGGIIDWFSKYEIKIELPTRRSVVCCRHAAYSLGIAT